MFKKLNINSKKNLFFITLPSILLISLPFLLLTGPFLPDLAVSLCAILFLLNFFSNSVKKFFRYFNNKFFFLFLLFYLILIFSSLFSDFVFFSLKTSIFYIRFLVFSLAVWFLLEHNNKVIIKYLLYSFLISYSILIADSYLQFLTGANIFGWKISGTRVSSFFGTELILGSYLSRLYPIFFAIYIYSFKKINFFFILIFILIEVLIFLSGERASFFYLNLSTLIIIIFSKNYNLIRLFIFSISLLILIFISFFNLDYKKRMIDNTLNQIIANNQDISKKFKIFSTEHQNHYKSAVKMFLDNKLIGIGPNLFRKNCNKKEYKITFESCTTHPHNTYVQLLAETGILGFSIIFLVLICFFYFCLKHLYFKIFYKKFIFTDFQIGLISAIIISLYPIVPTGNFFNNWLNVIYYLPVGFLLWSLSKNNKNFNQ